MRDLSLKDLDFTKLIIEATSIKKRQRPKAQQRKALTHRARVQTALRAKRRNLRVNRNRLRVALLRIPQILKATKSNPLSEVEFFKFTLIERDLLRLRGVLKKSVDIGRKDRSTDARTVPSHLTIILTAAWRTI